MIATAVVLVTAGAAASIVKPESLVAEAEADRGLVSLVVSNLQDLVLGLQLSPPPWAMRIGRTSRISLKTGAAAPGIEGALLVVMMSLWMMLAIQNTGTRKLLKLDLLELL